MCGVCGPPDGIIPRDPLWSELEGISFTDMCERYSATHGINPAPGKEQDGMNPVPYAEEWTRV